MRIIDELSLSQRNSIQLGIDFASETRHRRHEAGPGIAAIPFDGINHRQRRTAEEELAVASGPQLAGLKTGSTRRTRAVLAQKRDRSEH